MKKGTITALIVAGALIIAGGVLCAASVAGLRAGIHTVSGTIDPVQHEETLPIDPDGSITVHMQTTDVMIGLSPDDQVHLTYRDTGLYRTVVTADANGIDVRREDVNGVGLPSFARWFGRTLQSETLTLALPADFAGTLDVVTSTGDVYIMDMDAGVDALSVRSSTGHIRLDSVAAATLSLTQTTGTTTLTDVTVTGALTSVASTGAAQLTRVTAGSVTRTSGTGASVFSDVACQRLAVETTTGRVRLARVVCTELSARTTTGDIMLESLDAEDVTLKASTGDVCGSLVGTESMYVGGGTRKLDVVTTTGDIRLEYLG